ncbi:hypothetical protein PhCBS80983_g02432 [Powellomyces hirtus]|uniref:Uncharacterized protein n=1 Tax=Powellomyces hirtus TaxID=109895 RepID=A0A507E905_9FUNG|nr:hypothetical protein PhCBS80983_g02432 [Powellomyces hirtus]
MSCRNAFDHVSSPGERSPVEDELDWTNVATAATLILGNALVSMLFGLGLERTLIVSAIRCVVQLTIMGQILQPVFEKENPWFVAGLSALLIMISVLEIYFNRTKHRHDYMFATVLFSMVLSVVLTSAIGNAFAIRADPWWRPRTYIPTMGMLLGNSMSGMAVGLNVVMGQATENKELIELYLAYGATRWEAARPVVIQGVRTALLPVLNMMSVMGLISIPGMMTGQIMGGASIGDAVRYQQIITFMISACTTISTVASCCACVAIIFDDHDRLRLDRIHSKKKRSVVSATPASSSSSWSPKALLERS